MLRNAAAPRLLAAFLLAFALVAASSRAAERDPYPTKVVTLVAPFAPGGPTDTLARTLANALSRQLQGRVIVETLSGAGGTRGSERVARARPDGYTLLLHHAGLAVAPLLHRRLSFDPLDDLAPIGLVAEVPMTLIARPDLAPNNFAQLADWLRSQGPAARLAHAGAGSASHLCALTLTSALQVKPTMAAYRGTSPAVADLVKGNVDVLCDQIVNTARYIDSGGVKAYGVIGKTQLAGGALPKLERLALDGVELSIWYGLYAPAGTPNAVLAHISRALRAAMNDPRLREDLQRLGAQPVKPDAATPQALH
ncbi:MAG TPA: tripartite tricarboxylate transporter substrate-binding protein, partial [Burkholderiaceae bacterium]|nr:tripartite tricarboxylate transporter substrate-binding protein [Burkholderiaceae bacterium]